MNENPFQVFIDLVHLDQEIISLQKDIAQIEREINEAKEALSSLELDIQNAKYTLHEVQKEVDARELEMKDLEEQVEKERKRLDAVSNNKAYMSVKKEIEQVHKAQHVHEDVLLAAWNKLESVKQEYEIRQAAYDKKVKELQALIVQKGQYLSQLKADFESHIKQRDKKEKQVKPEFLEKYSMMRSRVANPVVPVDRGSCSACFYNITNQDMIELQKNKMLQCRGCYRFLYIKKAEE